MHGPGLSERIRAQPHRTVMINGTIKFFNAGKGFGFITPDGGGGDIFLPAATMSAAGLSHLKTGQRVLFEQAPDAKGPKAVKLQLVPEQPAPAAQIQAQAQGGRIAVYCDCASDMSAEILDAIGALGYQPQVVDYVAAPPGHEALRRLAVLLRATDQSLVRRYDPLFLELQLDDRFITETEFWTAIAEHPVLINGPVLVFAGRARICQSAGDVRTFLGKGSDDIAPKPKKLSPRIAAMLRGEPLPPEPVEEEAEAAEEPEAPKRRAPARQKAKVPAEKPARKTVKKKVPVKTAPAAKAGTKKKAPAKPKKK